MDFGDGVQNLLVEDVQLRDFLRQGVDLAARPSPTIASWSACP